VLQSCSEDLGLFGVYEVVVSQVLFVFVVVAEYDGFVDSDLRNLDLSKQFSDLLLLLSVLVVVDGFFIEAFVYFSFTFFFVLLTFVVTHWLITDTSRNIWVVYENGCQH
jgi:hypothetical protein